MKVLQSTGDRTWLSIKHKKSGKHYTRLCFILLLKRVGCVRFYWRTKSVRLNEHPRRLFSDHASSKKHTNSVSKRQEIKSLLVKGSIYKRLHDGAGQCERKKKTVTGALSKSF